MHVTTHVRVLFGGLFVSHMPVVNRPTRVPFLMKETPDKNMLRLRVQLRYTGLDAEGAGKARKVTRIQRVIRAT